MRQIKLACCNELFGERPIEDVCVTLKGIGYDGVEIAPFTIAKSVTDISEADRRRIKLAAQVAEIEVVGLHWVLAYTDGFHVCDPDRAVRVATSNYLVELVKFCADINGKVIVFGSPNQRSIPKDMGPMRALNLAVETFVVPARAAAEHGVTICIEPLSPDQTNFINYAAQAVLFVHDLQTRSGSNNVGIILDSYSMRAEFRSRGELIREHAHRLHHVHVNDLNKQGPGMAENGIDFTEVFEALLAIDYKGYVSVEAFDFSPGAEATARQSYNHLMYCYRKVVGGHSDGTAMVE